MTVPGTAASRTYRAIWRWHFYAGLIVAPFLLILSVTGAIYLFNDELDDALTSGLRFVPPSAARLPPARLVGAALAAYPGVPTRIDVPAARDRPAVVFVTPATGAPVRVPVDPGTGRVLGSFVYTRTLVGIADTVHGSLMLGRWGGIAMELAACWALVLIATGTYLWWPRGRRAPGGIVYPRLAARGRRFWRDLHAVTGAWAVTLIAFLIVTGLPWAVIEGPVLQRAAAMATAGYPASHSTYDAPRSMPMKAALGTAPWTLEPMPMPRSVAGTAGHAGHDMATGPIDAAAIAGLDRIAATLARDHGLSGGYRLFPPVGAEGVYTAYTYPDRPQGQRSLYFDRYSGRLIREVGYADYGAAARAIELGVQLHMGNYFGRANQIVMLLACVAIILLVISGAAMWWRRRPAGRWLAPPPAPAGSARVLVAILVVAGLALPALGASLLVIAGFDAMIRRLRSV